MRLLRNFRNADDVDVTFQPPVKPAPPEQIS
jgi:hypothetical protein